MGQRGAGAAAAEVRGREEGRHRGAWQSDAGGEPETPAAPERNTEFEGEIGPRRARWHQDPWVRFCTGSARHGQTVS